jgi:hypothetical protein
MSAANAPAKAPANDPLDFKQEQNALRFIRPSRWLALDIAGKPVCVELFARVRER